jgi:RNA polymerase sigma-70 factor (ECF subfamily)
MSGALDNGCSADDMTPPTEPLASPADRRFVELLEACRPYLKQLAQQLIQGDLRRRMDPSDVVQETLLRGIERLGEFQGESPAAQVAWLKEILRNLMTDLVRHHRAAKRDVGREGEQPGERAGADRSPSSAVRRREDVDRILDGMRQLAPEQREVIQLRAEGMTFPEIGERTGKSADALRMLWGRAVARLTELVRHDDSTS